MSMWIPTTEFDTATEPFILLVDWGGSLRMVERKAIKDATKVGPYFIGVDTPPIKQSIILEDKSYERPCASDREPVDDV